MGIHMVERVLWELETDREKAAQFQKAPKEFLAAYRLADNERCMLEAFDVQALAERGASTLLLMGAWLAVQGPATVGEYMMRMNKPRS